MTKKDLNREYLLAFFILWVFFYLLFPSWLLPVSTANKALIYVGLWVFFLVNGWLFYKWNAPYVKEQLFKIAKSSIVSFIRDNKVLVMALLFFSALQIYPMLMPLRKGDEGYHANNGIEILKMINIKTERFLPIDFHWVFKLLVVLLIPIFIVIIKKAKLRIAGFIKRNKYLFSAFLAIFFLIYFVFVSQFPYFSRLHRFPPISKIIHSLTYLLFLPTEFFVRLPQLIFVLLAAVFLFKMVSLFRERREAFFAALTFLCLPLVIYYANDGKLEAGTLFFIILVSYFFMRHLKSGTHRDFILTMFSLGLGFLYKRPLLIMIPLIWTFLLLRKYIKFDSEFSKKILYYLKFTWIGLVSIVPWLIITRFLPGRNYVFRIKNWFDSNIALTYLEELFRSTGLALAIILAISLIYCLVGKRDWLSKYSFVLFLFIYILITSDEFLYRHHYMEFRFSSYFSPSIAIFASTIFFAGLKRIKRESVGIISAALLFLLFFLHSSIIPPQYTGINPKIVTFYKIKSRYVPYDKALSYISTNFPSETRFHVSFGSNPVNFYAYKYNALNQRNKLRAEENFDVKTWKYPEDQTLENFYGYCVKNKIDYFMYPSAKWATGYLSESLIDSLRDKNKSGHKFEMIKEFESGGNYVFISKVLKK